MTQVIKELDSLLENNNFMFSSTGEGGSYVYVTVDSCTEGTSSIVYVGVGKGNRWKHTLSGNSSSKGLNKLVFSGAKLETLFYMEGLTSAQARELESFLIYLLKPSCNSVGKANCRRDEEDSEGPTVLEELWQNYPWRNGIPDMTRQ